MAEIKKLLDEFGVIYEGNKILPDNFKLQFLEALAELEDNECHKTRTFPKTRLHKVSRPKISLLDITHYSLPLISEDSLPVFQSKVYQQVLFWSIYFRA